MSSEKQIEQQENEQKATYLPLRLRACWELNSCWWLYVTKQCPEHNSAATRSLEVKNTSFNSTGRSFVDFMDRAALQGFSVLPKDTWAGVDSVCSVLFCLTPCSCSREFNSFFISWREWFKSWSVEKLTTFYQGYIEVYCFIN